MFREHGTGERCHRAHHQERRHRLRFLADIREAITPGGVLPRPVLAGNVEHCVVRVAYSDESYGQQIPQYTDGTHPPRRIASTNQNPPSIRRTQKETILLAVSRGCGAGCRCEVQWVVGIEVGRAWMSHAWPLGGVIAVGNSWARRSANMWSRSRAQVVRCAE